MRNCLVLVMWLGILINYAAAQQKTFWKKLHPDSLVNGKLRFLPIPMIGFSPETGFSYGLTVDYFFNAGREKDKATTRGSLAYIEARNTTFNQLTTELGWSVYTRNDRFFMQGLTGYSNFYERFWTLSDFNSDNKNFAEIDYQRVFFRTRVLRNLGNSFFAGAHLNFNDYRSIQIEQNTLASYSGYAGDNKSRIAGIGPIVVVDKRDNQFSPLETGWYAELRAMYHSKATGSEFNYELYGFDIRRYKKIRNKGTLAMQAIGVLTNGQVPLLEKNRMGNSVMMRGYFQGRFRDDQYLAAQIEYRYPVGKFIYIATFLSAGQTADKLNDLKISYTQTSGGAGIRVLLDKKKKIYGRLDWAYTQQGNTGFYARLGEAF